MKTKINLLLLALSLNFMANAQYSLTKIWQTDTFLHTPESVLFDADRQQLFVANIGGKAAWEKDNFGYISTLNTKGEIIKKEWANGLQGPKGMAIVGNSLYVADITELVEIDLYTGDIKTRLRIDSAQRLNDVTADNKGRIYVSDIKTGKIHLLENGRVSLYLDGLTLVNGLKWHKGKLYVLANSALWEVDKKMNKTQIAEGMTGIVDGVELVNKKTFLCSVWEGHVWLVKKEGTKQLLLDTKEAKISAADIGYNPKEKIVYVPTFFGNNIVAYKLENNK